MSSFKKSLGIGDGSGGLFLFLYWDDIWNLLNRLKLWCKGSYANSQFKHRGISGISRLVKS